MAIPSRKWRRLHRWVGLLIAAPVIILALTGMMLNHVEFLGLHQRTLPVFMASLYGVPAPEPIVAVEADGRWWSFVDDQLFLQDQPLGQCARPHGGVAAVGSLYVVGCDGALLLLDSNGSLVERIGKEFSVPAFDQLTEADGALVLSSGGSNWRYDIDQLSAVAFDGVITPVVWQSPPRAVLEALPMMTVPAEFNWQRFIQDVHSGRVLPLLGTLLMDAAALLLIVLALTGVIIWSRTRP